MSNNNGRDAKGRFLPGNKISKGHAFEPYYGNRYRESHGLAAMKKRLNELGSRYLDRRYAVGRALTEWRNNLIQDLGGNDAISTQQEQIVDICVRTKLLLDSLDTWLLQQQDLVRTKKRSVVPVLMERTKIAESLAKHLAMLGLERRKREKDTYRGFLSELEKRQQEKAGESE